MSRYPFELFEHHISEAISALADITNHQADPRVKAIILTKLEEVELWSDKLMLNLDEEEIVDDPEVEG